MAALQPFDRFGTEQGHGDACLHGREKEPKKSRYRKKGNRDRKSSHRSAECRRECLRPEQPETALAILGGGVQPSCAIQSQSRQAPGGSGAGKSPGSKGMVVENETILERELLEVAVAQASRVPPGGF